MCVRVVLSLLRDVGVDERRLNWGCVVLLLDWLMLIVRVAGEQRVVKHLRLVGEVRHGRVLGYSRKCASASPKQRIEYLLLTIEGIAKDGHVRFEAGSWAESGWLSVWVGLRLPVLLWLLFLLLLLRVVRVNGVHVEIGSSRAGFVKK